MDRENDLLGIRPIIELPEQHTTELEKFQNETLRPILKFQNPVLLNYMAHHFDKRKVPYQNLPKSEKKTAIRKALLSDQKLKTLLTGVVCGLFTRKEWSFYLDNLDDCNRRIRDLLIQRVESQSHKLYA